MSHQELENSTEVVVKRENIDDDGNREDLPNYETIDVSDLNIKEEYFPFDHTDSIDNRNIIESNSEVYPYEVSVESAEAGEDRVGGADDDHDTATQSDVPGSSQSVNKADSPKSPEKSNSNQQKDIQSGEIFYCGECGKAFKVKKYLMVHERTHSREKPYSCGDCGKKFKVKKSLAAHEKIHSEGKRFCCGVCGTTFTLEKNLTIHIRNHSTDKPFSCKDCGKSFLYKSQFLDHVKIHSDEKPFCCGECGAVFTHKANFKRHMRGHSGEKTYSCEPCGKIFRHRSNYLDHKKSHRGERIYSCRYCGLKLTHKSLRRHERSHDSKGDSFEGNMKEFIVPPYVETE